MSSNKNIKDRIRVGFYVYGTIVTLLTLAHELWMIIVYRKHLLETGQDPNSAYIDAAPMFMILPVFLVCSVPLKICMAVKTTGNRPRAMDMFFTFMTVQSVLYGVHTIVVMCKGMKAYISVLPTQTICSCYITNDTATLGFGSLEQLYKCACRIPFENDMFSLVIADPSNLDQDVLPGYGFDASDDPPIVNISDSKAEATQIFAKFTPKSLEQLILLVQASLIIYILRCPVGMVMSYFTSEAKIESTKKESEHATMKDAQPTWKFVRKFKTMQTNTKKVVDKHLKNREDFMQSLIGMVIFGFTECLDAFSLLEEFVENGDYFKANVHLTNTVIGFISINIYVTYLIDNIMITIGNMGLMNDNVENILKFSIVLVNNVPFLVIRIHLFGLFGISNSDQINTVFLLFILKETVLILLGIFELIFSTVKTKENNEVEPSVSNPDPAKTITPGLTYAVEND